LQKRSITLSILLTEATPYVFVCIQSHVSVICVYIYIHIYMYAYVHVRLHMRSVYAYLHICTFTYTRIVDGGCYGVATIGRLLKTISLFCKRALSKRQYSAKETYDSKEPTTCSHPIRASTMVSFAEYSLFNGALLQKKPLNLRSCASTMLVCRTHLLSRPTSRHISVCVYVYAYTHTHINIYICAQLHTHL